MFPVVFGLSSQRLRFARSKAPRLTASAFAALVIEAGKSISSSISTSVEMPTLRAYFRRVRREGSRLPSS
jgi:hypothetical protein